jgi:hypothetical protein
VVLSQHSMKNSASKVIPVLSSFTKAYLPAHTHGYSFSLRIHLLPGSALTVTTRE